MGLLGFERGILQAPLGPDISGPRLVAAVANAGAIGFLRAPDQDNGELLRQLIQETRSYTTKPFGVGFVLAFAHDRMLEVAMEERVGVLLVFWGEFNRELVDRAHKAGVKVIHQVGSVEEAKQAAASGVDAIVAQGVEAGGHVRGTTSLMEIVPAVVDAVEEFNIPVIAAGGISDARGYVAALALGAKGVSLGTRFVASCESYAHPLYKQKLVESHETAYTDVFGRARWPGAAHRVLKSPFFVEWKDKLAEDETEEFQPVVGETCIYGQKQPVMRFSGKVPNATTAGNVEDMAMYAGVGVRLIKEILPAATIVQELVQGAEKLILSMAQQHL